MKALLQKANEIYYSTDTHEKKLDLLFETVMREANPRFSATCPSLIEIGKELKKKKITYRYDKDKNLFKISVYVNAGYGGDWTDVYYLSPLMTWLKFIISNE